MPCGDKFPSCMFIKDSYKDKDIISNQIEIVKDAKSLIQGTERSLSDIVSERISEKIDMYILVAFMVLTFQIIQYIEWEDSRINANISAMPNMLYSHSWTRFYPDIVRKIWHPYLDLQTKDLMDSKSLSDPLVFYSFGISFAIFWY